MSTFAKKMSGFCIHLNSVNLLRSYFLMGSFHVELDLVEGRLMFNMVRLRGGTFDVEDGHDSSHAVWKMGRFCIHLISSSAHMS